MIEAATPITVHVMCVGLVESIMFGRHIWPTESSIIVVCFRVTRARKFRISSTIIPAPAVTLQSQRLQIGFSFFSMHTYKVSYDSILFMVGRLLYIIVSLTKHHQCGPGKKNKFIWPLNIRHTDRLKAIKQIALAFIRAIALAGNRFPM